MPRLDKTLADYVAIAISPALIMLMVGSLLWFLVAVFYQGNYDGRIYWILGCYTLAIVLITRIAIEEGKERAAMFGMALAMATGLATMRFTSSMVFHWFLLGLAWWVAHKLTMDCTFIDEEQDSSGQGLIQLIGFGKKRAEKEGDNGNGASEKPAEEQPAEPEGVTERVSRMREEAHPKRRTKGKGHAPGTWIVYFSLAALPLFGLGQMLVPVADAGRRLWTFQLLATYVAAGLGLLVTTSFLGLRRYLRQRGVQMPPQMAGVWIMLGAAIIVGLLAVCAIVPRPAAEYELARLPDLPFSFTTPERESNRYAMGDEGADKNDPDSQSYTQGEQNGERPEGGKSDNPESGGKEGSRAKKGSGDKKSRDGKPQGGSKGEKKEGSSGKQDPSSKQESGESKSQDRKSSDKQQSNGDKEDSPGDRKQSRDENKQSSDEKRQSSDEKSEGQEDGKGQEKSDDESSNKESSEDREDEGKTSESKDRSEQPRDGAKQPDRRSQTAENRNKPKEREDESKEQERRGGKSPATEPPKTPNQPPMQLPQIHLTGGLFGMLKFIVFVVLGCVALYWLWKNWARVVEGFRLFLQELRDLWAALFGGKPKPTAEDEEEVLPAAKPERPFRDYVDPFAAGKAARYAPAELVRYTFEATEAWARENGCGRGVDQTPHEFASQIGRQVESLRPGAAALAKLYSRAAYAPGSLAAGSVKPLAEFWQQLRTSHRPVVPPPPPPVAVGK